MPIDQNILHTTPNDSTGEKPCPATLCQVLSVSYCSMMRSILVAQVQVQLSIWFITSSIAVAAVPRLLHFQD
jgi:hypothetical protein